MGKDKRRNTEKRKEKSRDAARCRRGKETEVFVELSDALPLSESVRGQLDKASVMRLSISVLKIHNLLHNTKELGPHKKCKGDKMDHLYQKALEGFSFILSQEGDIVYLTESVAKYLGLQQIELMGQSMYDFTHPCDHEEMKEVLTGNKAIPTSQINGKKKENCVPDMKTFFLRMKCTLTAKGRNVNLKSATYKVMKCTGRLVTRCENGPNNGPKGIQYLVGVAEPIPQPTNIEVPLDSATFVSKHSMDMKFTYCDERIQELAGYSSDQMIDESLYSFHHALDSEVVDKAYKDLFSKGQTMTGAYRFLARHGGYMWMVTQATVINNSRTQKPQWVVCVHYVLSGIEEKELILSHVQTPPAAPTLSALLPPKLELSTEHIFAPKTKDMEKGYFVPIEMKKSITFLNNEPEDLSYLAPNAGDGSVPLTIPTFGHESVHVSPSIERHVLKQEPGTGPSTPDMGYRKDASPGSALSSEASSRISSPSDYLSMAMPGDVDAMDKFFQSIHTVENHESEVGEIDFDMRAPYIPMDGEEDLGLLPPSSNLLFNLTPEVNPGLFGRTETVFNSKQSLFEEPSPPLKRSMRDMLGESTAVASIEQPPDTMYLQLKRPLDMNSLEKGPPKVKVMKLDTRGGSGVYQTLRRGGAVGQPQTKQLPGPDSSKDSVLLNLLLRGEDRNHGYKVNPLNMQPKNDVMHKSTPTLFTNLTRHDCEVNAPTPAANLLQGRELLHALDVVSIKAHGRLAHHS